MIDSALAEFLHDGVGIHLATCTAALEPDGARAISARVQEDGEHVDVFMAEVAARRLVPLLETSRQAAVGFARPLDERACQLKGEFVSVRPADESEQVDVMRQWQAFAATLEFIGIPATIMGAGWSTWPCLAIRLRITEIYDQTPGAGAGAPLK